MKKIFKTIAATLSMAACIMLAIVSFVAADVLVEENAIGWIACCILCLTSLVGAFLFCLYLQEAVKVDRMEKYFDRLDREIRMTA